MSEGKYPFEGTPNTSNVFSKTNATDNIEHAKPENTQEEEKYENPFPQLVPNGFERSAIPSQTFGKLTEYSHNKSHEISHAHYQQESDKFTDNPINNNIDLKENWEKATAQSNDMEIDP